MDARPDSSSSSGRFGGQWSFLANPPQHTQPRSLPPSSYLPQSDRTSTSPQQYRGTSGSRSSLPRNLTTASVGGRSSATTPSQPVLIRVHSANASTHLNPAPRPRRPIDVGKNNGLPSMSEYSIAGILAAIQEDVESDINTISEILGRSRLVLADQHDSHMPPQGEIRAVPYYLHAVEEASASDERLASDDVFILREDSSLIDGSYAGSAAYGMLERLQAMPRPSRINNDMESSRVVHSPLPPPSPTSPTRSHPSPAVVTQNMARDAHPITEESHRMARQLLQSYPFGSNVPRTTNPTVSETRLFAGANGIVLEDPFSPAEASRELAYDQGIDDLSSSSVPNNGRSIRERVQNLLYVSDPTGLTAWLQGQNPGNTSSSNDVEGHLRELLKR